MKDIFSLFRREPVLYKLLTLAVLAAAFFIVCRIIYAGIIALPYPKELLEPSNVALTNTFLSGKSPYTLSALEWEVPGVNYDYPFLNSLIAAVIAKITRCTAVTAHFMISLSSILISGILGATFVSKLTKTTVAPVLASVLFVFCHWRYGYISASPDDLGLLILLLTSFAATSPKIKNKSLWCAIGMTLCFYTKQYFVFAAAGIFVYMLLYSRKDAFKFVAWGISVNVIITALITVFWPLYWTKAFLFTYVGTFVGGGGQLSTLIDQLKYIIIMFAALFVIIIIAVAMALKKMYRNNERIRSIKVRENDIFALSVTQSVTMIVPLSVIGKNDGALFTYFLQLWVPFVIIVALVCFERMMPEDVIYDTKEVFDVRHLKLNGDHIKTHIYVALYAVIAVSTIYFGFGKLPLHVLTKQEIADWQKAYQYTAEYSKEGDIYYSRGLSYDGFARGNGEWMCGHEGEPDEESEDILEKWGITPDSYPYVHMIVEQNARYRKGIVKKATDHEYALITFETYDRFIPFNEGYCEKIGYRCIDRLSLQFGNMPYEVVFYVPSINS